MRQVKRTLVLFDIDGTLVHTGRAGLRGMNAAFHRLHGRHGALDGVTFAGRTDRAIVTDVFTNLGHDASDAAIEALRVAYLEDLSVEIQKPVTEPCLVLPGIAPLLAALESRPEFVVALLTGNFEGGAAIKLGHFDLWRRFGFGAFGDRHVNRRDLVPVALARARDVAGVDVVPEDVVVIGDTPLDVDCALVHGARAIGVGTGPFSPAALGEAGAHMTVPTLEETDRIVAWLGDEP